MKKKKTVKTRLLSLVLVLLLLTGSVSGVHAEEAAGAEAAGSETTKEQVVESGDSSGSGDAGECSGKHRINRRFRRCEERRRDLF